MINQPAIRGTHLWNPHIIIYTCQEWDVLVQAVGEGFAVEPLWNNNGTATKQPSNHHGHALVVENLSGKNHSGSFDGDSSLQFLPAHHAKGVVETVHHLLSQKSEHGLGLQQASGVGC